MISLYTITNRRNGKIYIGQTVRPVASRWRAHLAKARNNSTAYLHNAIRKHGENAFDVVEILRVEDQPSASRYEKLLIAKRQSTNPAIGYNLTDGGENGIPNETVRATISKRMKGNKHALGRKFPPRTPEHLRRIGDAQRGRKRGPFSIEHKRKMSEAHKGRSALDRELALKMGLANCGRKHTEEARRNMANGHLGGKRSLETRARMSDARRRWWEAKKLTDPGFRLNRQAQTVKRSILN